MPTQGFGEFEVDPAAGELRKRGMKLRLSGQPFEILCLLIDRHGDVVTREELRSRLWPDVKFVDFEHGLNAAVNRLRETLGDSADRPRYVETLPRRGYRFIAPLKPTSADLKSPRLIDPVRSLAVLPLENLSGDPEQEYFADGMTEALISDLAKIASLRVISRTSVMRHKGVRKPLPEIARELNVDGVVEGAVLRSGERVRITAKLIHAASDTLLWAESYERGLRDVITLQREVARTIAAEIRIKLTPHESARLTRARDVVPQAHEAYLKGRYYWNKRTPEGLQKSLGYFQQAIEVDPGYAMAYAGIADAYTGLGFLFHEVASPLEVMPKARAAAQRALEIDETLAEAHATLAFISGIHDYDWEAAERGYQCAFSLNPAYAMALHWHAMYLAYQGKLDQAQAEIERARETDPLSLAININAAAVFYFRRDFDRAIEQACKTLDMDATFPNAHLILSLAYQQKAMHREALAEAEKTVSLSGRSATSLGCIGGCYAAVGRTSEAKKVIEELQELSERQHVSPFVIAWVHVNLRDQEAALAYLQQAYTERSAYLCMIKVAPGLDFLRSDSRFQDLQRRVGLYP